MKRTSSNRFRTKDAYVNVPESFLESIADSQDEILKLLQQREEQNREKPLGEYISETEAKKAFGRRTTWFWNLRKDGKLPFTKVGNKVFYAKSDLLNLMERNKKGNQNV